MKTVKSTVLIFACLSAIVMGAPAAPASKCQDIPVRVTLYSNAVTDPSTGATTPTALRSDGGGEYLTASIKVCSGTGDVVTTTEKRTFTFTFPAPIAGSVIASTPSWVPGSYAVSGSIGIRNVLYNKGSNDTFATMAGSMFTVPGDRAT